MQLSLGLAFLAGLASFLSPCVFSLVPVYISYLSGRSVASTDCITTAKRLDTFLHGLAFVLGFSFIFIFVLGLPLSALGSLLYDISPILSKIGGVIVILFGLHMTGILHISLLDYDLRPRSNTSRNRSYLSSALLGVFFSAGWSPCVGPVLGAILTLAVNEGSIQKGMLLLTAYSIGLAIPFLVAAVGIGWVSKLIRRYGKMTVIIEKIMGAILIVVGVMLFFGIFQQLSRFGVLVDFGI